MRYDDASNADPHGHSDPIARPDVDHLPAGSFGPATGNAITGQGTSSGASGSDSVSNAPATIVAVKGAGGDAVATDGVYQAAGQYGALSIDAQGNFSYERNPGTPDGVKDVFNYTIADSAGANSSTTLTIDIGQAAAAAAGQGVVSLPPGVELSDIHVNGRDLIVNMPDGTQMVIPNGAVFVPQIVIGDVEVPPTNVAALLIQSEPEPAAGPPPSSGGNWDDGVPPLAPGASIGDLIPPTELSYTPPTFEQPAQGEDTKPTVIIETPDNPAGVVDASESVSEKGLPERDGNLPNEPAGSGEIADGNPNNNSDPSETNTGTIVFTAKDGLEGVTINGTEVTAVGQQIAGEYGTLTITGINLATGEITYSYTLGDNTSGDSTKDVFTVVVTDHDGDTATGTLTVNIVDDTPTARNDTDALDLKSHVATGNVITGVGTTSGSAGADTVGADNASITSVSGAGGSDSTFDANGNLIVQGEYGTLTIHADGSYTYTLNSGAPGGSVDTFTYTLTDGDGDTSTATLTISNPDLVPITGTNALVQVDDDALPGGNPGGTGDTPDAVNTTGTLSGSGGNGALTFALTGSGAPAGFTYQLQANGSLWVMQGSTHVLTITVNGATGAYTVTQVAPIMHPPGGDENNVDFTITYTVTDSDGDSASGTLKIQANDDTPIAHSDTDAVDVATHGATGNVITGAGTDGGTGGPGADSAGADGNGHITGIAGAGGSDTTADGSGDFTIAGQYGTLTINEDGTYTYTLNAGAPGGAVDTFTYTFTDGDGDSTTATLTITNANQVPVTGPNAEVQLDDDALPGGNPGGPGDGPDAVNTTGTLSGSGGDGTLTFALQSSGAPSGFTYSIQANGDLWVMQGSTHVLTITVDSATGAYTVTQIAPIMHAAGGDENNADFTINYTVTDSDGDHAGGTLQIEVNDDTPIAYADSDSVDLATHEAVGNVITGAGTIGGLGGPGADSPGADGDGHIVGISGTGGADTVADASGNYTIAGQYGTLVINSDGTYTYTLNGGAPGGSIDVFTYTLSDADGDTTTATLTISNPDHIPSIVIVTPDNPAGAVNATESVSEAGLDSPRAGNVPNESPGSGEIADGNSNNNSDTSETNTGTIIFTALDGLQSVTIDGVAVTGVVGQQIQGTYGVLTITSVDLATGQIGYSYTLSDNTSGDNTKDVFNIVVTDSDGDQASGTLTVNIQDDVPTANNDVVTQAVENAPVTVNVVANDVFGADGVTNNHVTYVNGSLTGSGTLVYNNDGTFTYTPAAGEEGTVTFKYTITDGDGDQSTATVTIHLQPDSVPQVTNATATVDDDGLAGGNPGGTGDINANAGETPPGNPSEAIYNGTILVNYGGDTGTVGFAAMNGQTGTVGTETVTYSWNSGTETLTATVTGGARDGTTLFTVIVNPVTGAYTVTLLENVLQASGGDENNATAVLTFTATDSDGDHTNGTLTVTFNDDTPTLGTIQPLNANDDPSQTPSVGSLHLSSGADGFGSVTISPDLTGITSGGHQLIGSQTGDVYTAYADVNGDGKIDAGDTVVFTITVDPNGGTSGTYTFDLQQALDGTLTKVDIGGSHAFGAGPAQAQTLTNGGSENLAVISGWDAGAGFNFANWYNGTNQLPSGLTLDDVNGSSAGWGIGNNNFNAGEFMRFDFGEPVDDFDGAGPYSTASAPTNMPEVGYAIFKLSGFSASEHIYFVVHFTDGTSASYTLTGAQLAGAGSTPFEIDAPAGKLIDWIDLYTPDAGGGGKIDLVSVGTQSASHDITIPVNMTVTDGDGDSVTGSTTIHVTDGGSNTTPNAAIHQNAAVRASTPTAHIIAGNDNRWLESRAFATGHNAAIMGALAAAGLQSDELRIEPHVLSHPIVMQPLTTPHDPASVAFDTAGFVASPTHILQPVHEVGGPVAHGLNHHHEWTGQQHVIGRGEPNHIALNGLLHQATGSPALHETNGTAVTAISVSMPSAQQLLGVTGAYNNPNSSGGTPESQHNEIVGKVLADSLHGGGGHGPNIDLLLNGHGGQAGGLHVVQEIAHQEAVPLHFGHVGFTTMFGGHHMEPLHHDAPPAHA